MVENRLKTRLAKITRSMEEKARGKTEDMRRNTSANKPMRVPGSKQPSTQIAAA